MDFWSATRSLATSFFYAMLVIFPTLISRSTHLRCLALLEESGLTLLLGLLVLGEVASLASLLQDTLINALDIQLGRCSDDIASVHPSQRNAVDFEWTGHKENTLGKVLEEDNALAAEATSEEDDDGSGSERCSGLRIARCLAGLKS